MTLKDEVKKARQTVVTDGFAMSLGEVISLYKEKELIIDPVYQRLFRWDDQRKTRFVESLLLGIPIPPIFVFQSENGIWELVDGLQRISTVLQLTGDLTGYRAKELGPLKLNGTHYLPSLAGKRWQSSEENTEGSLEQSLQIDIRRVRIRVEILKSASDGTAKYKLFQRLNTGGASLSEQEVRNCIAVSLNKEFYDWLNHLSRHPSFITTTKQTEVALEREAGTELVLRFLAFRLFKYNNRLGVHEYLDQALLHLATDGSLNMKDQAKIFKTTFDYLETALNGSAFQRWDGNRFTGKFLMSMFEVISTGVSKNIDALKNMTEKERNKCIKIKVKSLQNNKKYEKYSGAGVPGTARLANLLPIAEDLMRP